MKNIKFIYILFYGFCILFFCVDCIYLQNQRLENIHYPETPFHSGFSPGKKEINHIYFQVWCNKYCSLIKEITDTLPDDYVLEIRGKMDATELPENRKKISYGRAESIRIQFLKQKFLEKKMKAIPDPEPEKYLGRDKFAPDNRVVRFRITKI